MYGETAAGCCTVAAATGRTPVKIFAEIETAQRPREVCEYRNEEDLLRLLKAINTYVSARYYSTHVPCVFRIGVDTHMLSQVLVFI